jgi:crotonobetainyl-CoA:carnitine CoA-transferase CaiB-like acyl-CoA transferase
MDAPGPLEGVRVVELASEHAAFAGKLLAELGADVVLVEPVGGHPSRSYGPFAGDQPDPERSLFFWCYNTSKRSVVLDLETPVGAELFRRLVATAAVVLEGEPPGRLGRLGLDHDELRARQPSLVWVSVTPFGRSGPRATEPATDLTILAGGGPVWSCGYDDHGLPPVRGGGNQGYHTGSLYAVLGALVALWHVAQTGVGQFVDVSLHAAANVTTEAATYEWLVARRTVQRQTGRHAAVQPTLPSQELAADGRYVNTGFPPRTAEEFRAVLGWLDELGLREEFPETALLELGVERGEIKLSELGVDALATEVFAAGREALRFLAERLPARQFFLEGQRRGLACGVVAAPEEVIVDEHLVARGFPVEVFVEVLGRSVRFPGAPFLMEKTPWRLRAAPPRIGEHNEEVLGPLRAEA